MELFLFPLVNVALFPKTTKPLNIFESRYLQMVKDAVKYDKYVAIGNVEDPLKIAEVHPGELVNFVNPIVGYGKVQIVEEKSNGYLLIFLYGQGKAKLGPVKEGSNPYIICEATPIVENLVPDMSLKVKINVINHILASWITKYFGNPAQSEMFLRNLDGPEAILSAFSAYLIKDFDLQQMVLEINDINEKIECIYRLIESNETLS